MYETLECIQHFFLISLFGSSKLSKVRAENAEVLSQRQKEAEDAIRLMRETVLRKVDMEESKNGAILI